MANPDSVAGGIRQTARGFEIDPSVVATVSGMNAALAGINSYGANAPAMAAVMARGFARLGSAVTPLRTKAAAEPFVEAGWTDATGTQNFVVPTGVVGGGFLRGNTATNSKVFQGSNSARIPRVVALDEVTPWWLSFGFRVNSPTTGNWCLFGMSDPGSIITAAMGLYVPGPGGTSKFAAYTYNGVGEDDTVSTISVDGGIHTGEIWFDGTHFWLSVDQETPIQMAHTHLFAGTAVAPCWLYQAASGNTMDVFWRSWIWPVAFNA